MNYQWHDIKKNPNDLPKKGRTILLCTKDFEDDVEYTTGRLTKYGYETNDCDDYFDDDWVIAWKEIEPFKGE